jgi:hypothetical protein
MSFNTTKNTAKEVAATASLAIMNESVDVAKINVGKVIYSNARILLAQYMPKVSWYQKLIISKDKRELAELMAVYGLLHILKTRYSHYILDAVTSYINLELQTKLIGSINVKDLDNIFKLPEVV